MKEKVFCIMKLGIGILNDVSPIKKNWTNKKMSKKNLVFSFSAATDKYVLAGFTLSQNS